MIKQLVFEAAKYQKVKTHILQKTEMIKQLVFEASQVMGLNKALKYCGLSKCAWYYAKKPRDMPIDPDIVEHIKEIGTKRSTYSTKQMAAQISRETGILTNHKKIQRTYQKIDGPSHKRQNDVICTAWSKLFKPATPNQL